MSLKVNIPVFLQHYTNDVKVAEVNGNTVGECLDDLAKQFPGIEKELFDEDGELDVYIDIYVNKDSAYPEELKKPVKDGDELSIIFIVSGG